MVCKNSSEKEVKYNSESQKKRTQQKSMEYMNSQINSTVSEISNGVNVNGLSATDEGNKKKNNSFSQVMNITGKICKKIVVLKAIIWFDKKTTYLGYAMECKVAWWYLNIINLFEWIQKFQTTNLCEIPV